MEFWMGFWSQDRGTLIAGMVPWVQAAASLSLSGEAYCTGSGGSNGQEFGLKETQTVL